MDGDPYSVMADHELDDLLVFNPEEFDINALMNYDPLAQQPPNHQQFQEDTIGDTIDPMDDPFIQNLFDDHTGLNKASGSGTEDRNMGQNETFYVSDDFEFWPLPAASISCSFCQVLREIIHTNGIYSTKLEIHGKVGMICHAILVTQDSSGNQTHQMLDLSKKSIESVKLFLLQYCDIRKQGGFVLVYDPMAPFYEALCVGMDLSDYDYGNSDDESDPPSGPSNSNLQLDIIEANPVSQVPVSQVPKTRYQKQRDRAANLTVEEVSGYFHLTLTKAAMKLGICATAVKKFCRRHGMPRWPFRKIRSFETRIADLTGAMNRAVCVSQRKQIEAEIKRVRREIDEIYIHFRAS
ncbi:hypothetical protein QQ045_005959 [Rhodiola kirilowii]